MLLKSNSNRNIIIQITALFAMYVDKSFSSSSSSAFSQSHFPTTTPPEHPHAFTGTGAAVLLRARNKQTTQSPRGYQPPRCMNVCLSLPEGIRELNLTEICICITESCARPPRSVYSLASNSPPAATTSVTKCTCPLYWWQGRDRAIEGVEGRP